MNTEIPVNPFKDTEELLNIISHGIGFLLGLLATILLAVHSVENGDIWYISSFVVYGLSIVILYLASTLYHAAADMNWKKKMRVFDHAAIYLLIAGSYTPFTLVTLADDNGIILFFVIWTIAIFGVFFKLFFTGRFEKLSTIMYVLMGWLGVFAIGPLMEQLSCNGLMWLMSGGIAYTIGAVFYSMNNLKFNHAIWHMFVLAGTFCHFVTVYWYV